MLTIVKPIKLAPALLIVSLCFSEQRGTAQDNVTVPKSRLEELERKEKELERLKGDLDKTKDENLQLKKEQEKTALQPVQAPPSAAPVATSPPATPIITYVSPPLESLPAFQPYEIVDSMDLANYYHADTGAADRRFRKQKLSVRGEIVGFEKPLLKRNYRILLKSPMRETKVICDLLPPEKSNAVFTTDHGEELVALFGENRVPIAKVGQTVVVKGECKGRSDSEVMILGWDLKLVH
jgi:hypothetical protein